MRLSDQTLQFGESVITALLGVDGLYRQESGDQEGLAVLNMDSQGLYRPADLGSYAAARQRFEELKAEAAALPEPDRRMYYDQLCHSTLAFIQWRDSGLPFVSQLGDFLHVPPEPVSDAELDRLRGEMRALLNQMGYDGDLAAQCAAWEERNRVPPDEVQDVLETMMDEAWERTERYLLKIPAPRSDAMRVKTVSGVAYNARCDYAQRTIDLNTDPILTRPGLKHLTVHEGCPGHYLQFKLRETWHREGSAPADVLLSVVNTASSSVFEGIADTGLRMLRWVESDDDRLSGLMGRYRAGIGTAAAWRLHALGWPVDKTTDWLRSQSLSGGEGWVANRIKFLAAPSRAVLIWSYWWGEKVVAPVWARTPATRQADFLRYLYGRMHSNHTVAMFE
jgi:hypothetical protein